MIYTSLAVLAMSASALASPLSNPIHLHPKMADTRVSLTLVNNARGFRDVKIAGRSYTVPEHQLLHIKAPVGTVIYADSRTPTARRGDVLLEVTPQIDHTAVNLD